MRGPEILARTMSVGRQVRGSLREWQYHPRSDRHSKVACWTVLFDLLVECDALREAAMNRRIAFGINREMVGPINKKLDMVITTTQSTRVVQKRRHFADLVDEHGIVLSADERGIIAGLPTLEEAAASDVTGVALALEAKACMTEHIKSLPRLYAEILATGYVARLASPHCITASYSIVNAASSFSSPSGDGRLNKHAQPEVAQRVVSMIKDAVPTSKDSKYGYDVVGISVLNCANDGSPVTVVQDPNVAPSRRDLVHYEQMITRICSEFYSRFSR